MHFCWRGATTSLYIDDKAAPAPTATYDIDLVVKIELMSKYSEFEQKFEKKGFKFFDPSDDDENKPICRKYISGIKVDVMPINEEIIGCLRKNVYDGKVL